MQKSLTMDNDELYTTYHGYVRYVALQGVSKELAEDLTQDTFVKAYSAIERNMFDGENVKSWLASIAKNTLRDYWRKHNRVKPMFTDEYGRYYDIQDVTDDSYDLAELKEMGDEIKDLIIKLSKDQQYVFMRFYIDGVSSKDIATELGVSINTVLGRLRYGRIKLKNLLR